MPFFFVVVGAVFIIASVRNTQGDLLTLIEHDFTGPDNFVYWFISIVAIGVIGYFKPLKPISNGFLALIIVVLLLNKGGDTSSPGFFTLFNQEIGALAGINPAPVSDTYSAGVIVSPYDTPAPASSGGGAGGIFSTLLNDGLGFLGL